MYVIRLTATASATGQSLVGRSIANGSTATYYFPADRCVWQITAHTGGGYEIANVYVFDGVTDNGVDATGGANLDVNASFGYIGKSGRFVELAQ